MYNYGMRETQRNLLQYWYPSIGRDAGMPKGTSVFSHRSPPINGYQFFNSHPKFEGLWRTLHRQAKTVQGSPFMGTADETGNDWASWVGTCGRLNLE